MQDLGVVKGVLRYSQCTMDCSLVFRKSDENVQLQGYCDADWASSYTERKSISANVYQLNGNSGLISFKKQETKCSSSV